MDIIRSTEKLSLFRKTFPSFPGCERFLPEQVEDLSYDIWIYTKYDALMVEEICAKEGFGLNDPNSSPASKEDVDRIRLLVMTRACTSLVRDTASMLNSELSEEDIADLVGKSGFDYKLIPQLVYDFIWDKTNSNKASF